MLWAWFDCHFTLWCDLRVGTLWLQSYSLKFTVPAKQSSECHNKASSCKVANYYGNSAKQSLAMLPLPENKFYPGCLAVHLVEPCSRFEECAAAASQVELSRTSTCCAATAAAATTTPAAAVAATTTTAAAAAASTAITTVTSTTATTAAAAATTTAAAAVYYSCCYY